MFMTHSWVVPKIESERADIFIYNALQRSGQENGRRDETIVFEEAVEWLTCQFKKQGVSESCQRQSECAANNQSGKITAPSIFFVTTMCRMGREQT